MNIDIAKQVISKSNQTDIFDLTEAISKKNLLKALDALSDIRAKGQSDVATSLCLNKKFKELYLIKSYLTKGLGQNDIANKLRCHPYVVKLGINTVKNFTLYQLENAFLETGECEKLYKLGVKNDILETTLIKILNS